MRHSCATWSRVNIPRLWLVLSKMRHQGNLVTPSRNCVKLKKLSFYFEEFAHFPTKSKRICLKEAVNSYLCSSKGSTGAVHVDNKKTALFCGQCDWLRCSTLISADSPSVVISIESWQFSVMDKSSLLISVNKNNNTPLKKVVKTTESRHHFKHIKPSKT